MSDIRIVQRPSGAEVDVLSDRVVKRQDPQATRCECERTEWGERIGLASGLFRVPRILSCDESRGEIVFERLDGMRMFGDAVAAGAQAERLMTRHGKALAAIHNAMPAPDRGDDAVSLHGDFSYVNLFHAADTE
jgi:tRNA A-37 threonylcarbamoyl transferase component Bud32